MDERKRQRKERDEDQGQPDRSPQPRPPEVQIRALAILDEILKRTPRDDPRRELLELLQQQLEVDEKQLNEARQGLAEFNKIYEKLTSPANRIGTYLGSPDADRAHIAVGDAEYYANVDPKIDLKNLKTGTRVKINEAFAVIGDMGYHPEGPIVRVAEFLPDGRVRISADGQPLPGRIVLRSTDLTSRPLKAGDELRLDPSMRVAVEHFQKSEVRGYFLEGVPEIPWNAIGGQEKAIQVIRETIELPLLHPELYKKFAKKSLKGILLYGPPGCGKTLLGKATAYNLTRSYAQRVGRDVREYFMFINGPQLLNMWLGETERMVREIFAAARERAKEGYLVFVFIDEADALLRVRSSGRYLNIANTVVPQFASEMDGLIELENVVVMLTSNRPDYIDPAILRPERIDRRVKVGRPDRTAAADIFRIYLATNLPYDTRLLRRHGGDVESARGRLVQQCVEFLFDRSHDTAFLDVLLRSGRRETLHWGDLVSGALIMSTVERAKEAAIRRCVEKGVGDEGIGWEDLREAIRQEYRENEIFPKTDYLEDWLRLLDYEAESVVEVRPAREDGPSRALESVV